MSDKEIKGPDLIKKRVSNINIDLIGDLRASLRKKIPKLRKRI